MRLLTLSALCIIGWAGVASAQEVPTPEDFVARAASSGMFEIESSKLALAQASSANVKRFADQMIADHGKAAEELKQAAGKGGNTLPAEMKASDKAAIDALAKKKGDDFDRIYAGDQQAAHDEAVALFEVYAAHGTEPNLKAFAEATLPTLKMHQQHAMELTGGKPAIAKPDASNPNAGSPEPGQ